MYTPQILTCVDVIEDKVDSNYFRVVGRINAAGDYYDKVIVVANDINIFLLFYLLWSLLFVKQ